MYESAASPDASTAHDGDVAMVGLEVPLVDLADGSAFAELPPSGLLLDLIAGLTPGGMRADQVLDAVAALERIVSCAQAVQSELLARFAQLRPADERRAAAGCGYSEFAADELAPVLKVSRHQAADRLALATDLARRFPDTLADARRGEVALIKTRALSELTGSLTDAQAKDVQARVLPDAATRTPAQFRAAVRRAVLDVDPGGRQERERLAREDRRVVVTPVDDGMAELWALLPAAEAVAIRDRIDRCARTVPTDDTRTIDQRRADCLTDLLVGTTAPRRVTTQVHVTVPAATLARAGSAPGHLDGYGPITATTARELAAGVLGGDTTWRRILTDPVDGTVLDVGRDSYRPPAALADHVRIRDRYCRFPGCRVSAQRADLDHTVPYQQDGSTSAANLGALCRHHHRLKHETDWQLIQDGRGRFTWTSPTGHTYTTGPEPDPA